MQARDLFCALTVACICSCPSAYSASQEEEVALRSFSSLGTRLEVGDRLSVRETSGDTVDGKFQSLDFANRTLILSDAERTREEGSATEHDRLSIPERSIREVWLIRRRSGVRGAAIGAAIGVGVASLFLVADAENPDYDPQAYFAAGVVVFAPIGAAVGYFNDRGESGRDRIYTVEAPSSSLRWRVVPVLSKNRRGVVLNLSF